jgi:hypothetical protein
MPKFIDIEIDEEGKIKIETEGFVGKECIKESQFIKDLLGTEKSRKLKPVYFIEKPLKVKNTIRNKI